MDVNITGLKASDRRTPIAADLTNRMALDRAASHVIATRPSIDMVIYNAGVSQIAPFAKSDPDRHRRVFDINYFAAVEMARMFLNPIRKSSGTHLAISSVAGFAPLHGRTAYAASKHAKQGFFSSLRSEEEASGVRCLIAAPNFVATNIGNAERTDDGIMRPDAAKMILRGALKGKEFIPVGRVALLASLLMRVSPKLYQFSMPRNILTEKPGK